MAGVFGFAKDFRSQLARKVLLRKDSIDPCSGTSLATLIMFFSSRAVHFQRGWLVRRLTSVRGLTFNLFEVSLGPFLTMTYLVKAQGNERKAQGDGLF